MTRAELRTWPDGEYEFIDYLDDDGVDPEPVPIRVKVSLAGDSITIDFTGSSPQVRGGINSPYPFTVSCAGYAVRSIMRTAMPNTSGLFRPMQVIAPPGTILNPVMPAASGMRGVVGFRLIDAVMGALAQIKPDRVPAAGEGGNSMVVVGGYKRNREPFVMFDMIAGTWGARPDKDGNDGLTNPSAVVSNIPVELMELEYPVRVEQYAFKRDSGGAGKYRGGVAITRSWRYLGDTRVNLTVRSDRRQHPPYGLYGGQPGAPSINLINPGTAAERLLPTKFSTTLEPGDLFYHEQPGGGGWGNPLERTPEAVLNDVLDDKVSIQAAEEEYGIAVDPETRKINAAETQSLRARLSQQR